MSISLLLASAGVTGGVQYIRAECGNAVTAEK